MHTRADLYPQDHPCFGDAPSLFGRMGMIEAGRQPPVSFDNCGPRTGLFVELHPTNAYTVEAGTSPPFPPSGSLPLWSWLTGRRHPGLAVGRPPNPARLSRKPKRQDRC